MNLNKNFSSYYSISNKILFVVLLIIMLFSIGLSVSVGVTSFRKLTDITMNELNRMSAVFARHIEGLEKKSIQLVKSTNGNKRFLELTKQLANKGPSYALDAELNGQIIEESERIFFFQSQLKLVTILLPLLKLNNLDSIDLYLAAPFDMIKLTEGVPVLKIDKNYIYVNQFKRKFPAKKNQWYKIKIEDYKSPPVDYFDISSVYSKPLNIFVDGLGFIKSGKSEFDFPSIKSGFLDPIGSDVRIENSIPVLNSWHTISLNLTNPERFEEEFVSVGFISVDQKLSKERIELFENEFSMELGVAYKRKMLVCGKKLEKDLFLQKGIKVVNIGNIDYFLSEKQVLLNNYNELLAITLSPVSLLNKYTQSLSTQITFTGIFVMLIAGVLIFFLIQTQVRKPLNQLVSGVSLVAEGKFEAHVDIVSKDEFGVLAKAFNDMSSNLDIKTEDLYRSVSELKKAQSYISNIINSMPSILIGVDSRGKITQWNTKAEEIVGIKADIARGQNIIDIFPHLTTKINEINESIQIREIKHEKKKLRVTKKGTLFEDITIYPLVEGGVEGAVIRVDDVTEQVRMEEMMVQTEKMMSVGGLAAGMAHEINNPLGIIIGLTQSIALRFSNDLNKNKEIAEEIGLDLNLVENYMEERGIKKKLEGIFEAGGRAAKIVRDVLNFSRKSKSVRSDCNIHELLENAVELASKDYNLKKKFDFRSIQIVREFHENLPVCEVIETEIEQVFLNLLINAAQAMSEKKYNNNVKPQLILRTIHKGEKLRIEIEDNGPGMDRETKNRIFEPFYTTKEVGTGTGLGLSVSYFIITNNHNGEFFVESSLGVGSKFVISLL